VYSQAGLPASGSSYSPRLPIPLEQGSGFNTAFIPGYGGGPATVSNRLPYAYDSRYIKLLYGDCQFGVTRAKEETQNEGPIKDDGLAQLIALLARSVAC
jgi:hypothetical protein